VIDESIETPHGDQVPRSAATTAIPTAEIVSNSTGTSVSISAAPYPSTGIVAYACSMAQMRAHLQLETRHADE
jgi:hypothetical protein